MLDEQSTQASGTVLAVTPQGRITIDLGDSRYVLGEVGAGKLRVGDEVSGQLGKVGTEWLTKKAKADNEGVEKDKASVQIPIRVKHIGRSCSTAIKPGTCEKDLRKMLRDRERERMAKMAWSEDKEHGTGVGALEQPVGLALSGGGIRSATFGLGVMQALAQHGWMKHFDYLSTVSGGGYIGASLSWFLGHRKPDDGTFRSGTGPESFPFDTEFGLDPSGDSRPDNLQRLRQHGNYLTPGKGHGLAALIGVIVRGAGLSMGVYLAVLTLILGIVWHLHLFDDGSIYLVQEPFARVPLGSAPGVIQVAVSLAGLFLFFAVLYSLLTAPTFLLPKQQSGAAKELGPIRAKLTGEGITTLLYRARGLAEKGGGALLIAAVPFLVLGTLPIVSEFVDEFELAPPAAGTGTLSVIAGLLTSLRIFQRTQSKPRIIVPIGLLAPVSAGLIVYGLLLVAYWASEPPHGMWTVLVPVGVAVAVGFFADLNLVSIHRFYQDRLMETFLPNVSGGSRLATEAEVAPLADFGARRPYHIVNSNVVLVRSDKPRFRGRGGDSFILSPELCGSSATGWLSTEKYNAGRMMLATAMAISGAAAHPNTGVGGEGPTRGGLVSFLMAFFNVRLGWWGPNPKPTTGWLRRVSRTPTFVYPGLWSLFRAESLNEDHRWVELTDGGHFENLGIYELVRRRCKVIVVCDAGSDPGFKFADLGNAIERVRADFGVLIDLSGEHLNALVPPKGDPAVVDDRPVNAERGFLLAPICYPVDADKSASHETRCPGEEGVLIYIKTTLVPGLPADVYAYKAAHNSFPDQSTVDQFFDEKQFEAYRELGFKVVHHLLEMMREPSNNDLYKKLCPDEKRLMRVALDALEENADGQRPLFAKGPKVPTSPPSHVMVLKDRGALAGANEALGKALEVFRRVLSKGREEPL